MKTAWFLLLGLAGVVVAGLCRQHQVLAALRQEAEGLRAAKHKAAVFPVTNPTPPAKAASGHMQADEALVGRLRGELEAIRQRVESAGREAAAKGGLGAKAPPSLHDGPISSTDWRNAGRATPAAVFETALWSAAGGDTAALADTLVLDAAVRAKAADLLAGMPAGLREQFPTPEKFVAFMTVRDVPEGTAQILGLFSLPTGTTLAAQLVDANGQARRLVLAVQPDGDQWRLVVPAAAIDRYAAFLRSPEP